MRTIILMLTGFITTYFVTDELWYLSLMKGYDLPFEIHRTKRTPDILVVGSSHIGWAVLDWELREKTGVDLHIVAPPGADIEFRKVFLQEYARGRQRLPAMILFEVDPWIFSNSRYVNRADLILGYYPMGYFKNYIEKYYSTDLKFKLTNLSKAWSTNSAFGAFSRKLREQILFRWRKLFPLKAEFVKLEEIAQRPEINRNSSESISNSKNTSEVSLKEKERELRILNTWKHLSEKPDKIDPSLFLAFKELLTFLGQYPKARVVFIETPVFRGVGSNERAAFSEIRNSIKTMVIASGFKYFRPFSLEEERNPLFFYDATHLDGEGKNLFTRALIQWLKTDANFLNPHD